MSVQALEILKGYITCEDPATRNKFFNLLDSFWHKADGKVLKNYTVNLAGDKTFVFLDKDGNQESITLPALPNSKPISFIDGLADALANKVAVVPGKQLSTEDFTTALLQKLNGLTNYVHPEFHQIAEVEGLAQALADLAPPEGFGFSELNFSPAYRDKIDNYPIGHYAAPVDDLAALATLPEADIPPYQRRPVKSEKVDYFYDLTAVEGDVAPNDQTNGTGFWMRGVNSAELIDNLTSTETTKGLTANQGRVLKGLIDQLNNILTSDDTTLDELQEIVNYIKQNKADLENLSIANIAGLSDALTNKVDVVVGKGLSTNDFTDVLMEQIDKNKVQLGKSNDVLKRLSFSAIDVLDTVNEDYLNIDTVMVANNVLCQKDDGTWRFITRTTSSTYNYIENAEKTRISLWNLNDYMNKANAQKHGYVTALALETSVQISGNTYKVYTVDATYLGNVVAGSQYQFTYWRIAGNEKPGKGRPTKLIDNATQYTLVAGDQYYHLKIINPINLIAPSGVFADSDEIQFKNYSAGDVTMVEGSGTTLEVVSSQQKVVPAKGFGGMRYESASKAGVFGQLKPI